MEAGSRLVLVFLSVWLHIWDLLFGWLYAFLCNPAAVRKNYERVRDGLHVLQPPPQNNKKLFLNQLFARGRLTADIPGGRSRPSRPVREGDTAVTYSAVPPSLSSQFILEYEVEVLAWSAQLQRCKP